ncbi:MAG: 2-amino-4-hydroxy-6-hydroxymethyldihydropteridine diphosphokinase [Sediminibacterium sp.]|jgi:2-amino-4-hydroxy-6-hydroxymethyldihydropteridine diphosphokinase|uniref:2-amino-4-hydroxy-6- hydroxymethyldihydropteridine diphosphokinase n=1 Tax=Sediminibacterium sp. TaxID=1917865 RepID=UPI002AB8ADFB|nr:2-amino-4-hydroxy-6-hydroxymethyldihydropteridine diphosphokinase [Sediminibacterium sp.]MDZ4070342.1 2-amino-4-hydroxy-6-hydroxymethyldihydropteridine diphosphokinase [Sediminibacterium sp.]
MNTAYLLTGGNMGNRLNHLRQAAEWIQQKCGKILAQSSVYETEAWGKTDQPAFLNQALQVETDLSPDALMQALLDIETVMGRTRTIKMGPRIIDLDILLIDDLIQTSALLTIPHPALTLRKFALLPLAEIAPLLMHPLEKKSILELLEICPDTLNVQKK